MDYSQLPIPHTVPTSQTPSAAPLGNDELPASLTSPPPPTKGSKSIFAFWHSGIKSMPPYLLRNVLSWHTRFSPHGWTIYVIDTVPDSPLHMANYIDITSSDVFPASLINDGMHNDPYAAQHTSDLIRYPLLLKYGGMYLDVGVLQFGDINWLWEEHISNPDSPYDYAGMMMGDPADGAITIINFNVMTIPDSPLIERAHKIFLKVWEGKTSTKDMCKHPIVQHVPLLAVPAGTAVSEEGKGQMDIDDESMTDYAIHIQVMGAAQRWRDEAAGWDGPAYVRDKCWLYSMVDMAYVNEQITGWVSRRQYELFKTKLPGPGEEETADQKLAREMVEGCIGRSWCLKLAHGFSARLFGAPTLGMLWRDDKGSDCEEGTYGGWLRWAEVNLTHDSVPKPLVIPILEPTRVASLDSYL